MNILHVDDSITFTEILSKLLELYEHTCDVSNDAKKALQLTLTNKYDAIILDLDMPEFTGKDFINELEKLGIISSQNIIVLTGLLPSEEEVDEMIKKGVKTCVEKPISIEELNDILASFVVKSTIN